MLIKKILTLERFTYGKNDSNYFVWYKKKKEKKVKNYYYHCVP